MGEIIVKEGLEKSLQACKPVRNKFTFFLSFQEVINELEDCDQLEFYRAISMYALFGVAPVFSNKYLKLAWLGIQPNIDTSNKRRECGEKGGAPVGNSNASKTTKIQAENNQNSNNKEKDREKDRNKKESKPKKTFSLSIPQSEEEFREQLKPYVERYGQPMIKSFFLYWSELYKDGRMKVQHEKSWELGKRLARWANNNYNKQ